LLAQVKGSKVQIKINQIVNKHSRFQFFCACLLAYFISLHNKSEKKYVYKNTVHVKKKWRKKLKIEMRMNEAGEQAGKRKTSK
jgi:hypothetical protein